MRKLPFTCCIILSGLLFCVGGENCLAQSSTKKKDPFDRKAARAGAMDPADEGTDNIVIGLQLIEVPKKAVFKWEQEGLNWPVWHQNANELIDGKEARLLSSTALVMRSGQRSQVMSVLHLQYPKESTILEIDPGGAPFPTAFEDRKLGLILMADPVLGMDRKELHMNYSLEWSAYDGENTEVRPVSSQIADTDVVAPRFKAGKVSNSVRLFPGEYRMLTQFEGENEESVVLVFCRYNLVTAAPLQDKSLVSKVEGVQLRSYWVDVSADLWHSWLRKESLSSLFGGGAWAKVSGEIQNGDGAGVLAAPTLVTGSGQRAKVEVVSEISVPVEFTPPKVKGGPVQIARKKSQNIGFILEVDPVLGTNGTIDLNFAADSSVVRGSAVSYRHEENGKWVPSISQPKIFYDAITTQVALDKDMKLLTAVMTPSKEDGSLDYSRKILFFVHNETYRRN